MKNLFLLILFIITTGCTKKRYIEPICFDGCPFEKPNCVRDHITTKGEPVSKECLKYITDNEPPF